MSGFGELQPTPDNLRAVQIWLNRLDDISEGNPQAVIDATEGALPLLATWTTNDAYAWALALRAKAFRFLDRLDDVLHAADSALANLNGDKLVAAHLSLEAGMALTQTGREVEAIHYLRDADRAFDAANDSSGRAWALVSLAEAYSGNGMVVDPEPVLRSAISLAEQAGDDRALRRAWKQLAVVCRHKGRPMEAWDAISRALDGDLSSHTRANYVLERGHLQAWLSDYAGADESYQEALVAYLECGDLLGQANVERALAINALILGRHGQGERRLDRAADLYRRIQSAAGLGYVLRERALVHLTNGDTEGALSDIDEGLKAFRRSDDTLGLAGMLRAAARVRHVAEDRAGAEAALEEAHELTKRGMNPLSEAGLLLLTAEIGESAVNRLVAGQDSARLYESMGIRAGQSYALSQVACAHADLGDPERALEVMLDGAAALWQARGCVVDAERRQDHDFALHDVTTNLLNTGVLLGARATKVMADLIVDEAPLGLRNAFQDGALPKGTDDFLQRFARRRPGLGQQPAIRKHALQQLGVSLASVEPDCAPSRLSFSELAAVSPETALLTYGAPTRDGMLPIAYQLPGDKPEFMLAELDEQTIDEIDSLGYALVPEKSSVLWATDERSWQQRLSEIMLPLSIKDWLVAGKDPSVRVLFAPVLAHVPIEALLVDGEPLGIRVGVTRIVVPTSRVVKPQVDRTVAYLDPDLAWGPERQALRSYTEHPERIRSEMGRNQLLLIACHGESAIRAEGALISSTGLRVVDAIDLLSTRLTNSVVVLESCYSGRYMGARAGEQLSLATVSLLSGASAVVAGLFALPADDSCTGVIAAALIRELVSGTPVPEALRRARRKYWLTKPDHLPIPGQPGNVMSGDAPWAWAGLCAYSR